jgi:hypothetical protein
MATGRFDIEDVVPSIVFLFVGAATAGLVQLSLNANIQLSDSLFNLGGTPVSTAFVLSMASIGVIAMTNEMDLGDFKKVAEGEYRTSSGQQMAEWARVAVLGMFGLVIGIEFVPGIESWVTGSDVAGFITLAVEAAGVSFIAYGS